MNRYNINHTIRLLRNTPDNRFNLLHWFTPSPQRNKITSLQAFRHACGTTACVGGLVGFSPRWKNIGGKFSPNSGLPCITVHFDGKEDMLTGVDAIAWYWDVPRFIAERICLPVKYSDYPITRHKDIAIQRLTRLKNNSELEYLPESAFYE